jgi:hypothetical protein
VGRALGGQQQHPFPMHCPAASLANRTGLSSLAASDLQLLFLGSGVLAPLCRHRKPRMGAPGGRQVEDVCIFAGGKYHQLLSVAYDHTALLRQVLLLAPCDVLSRRCGDFDDIVRR